jgi:signal transduction histidine kinase/ActR/RegA family two-component response regulator
LTGYAREEIVGRIRTETGDAEFRRRLAQAISSGGGWSGRLTSRHRDGTAYEEDAVISPVKDGEGRIVNFVAVRRDVTAQATLEQRLRQAQKLEAIGQLAGGVAHDFNNMLTIINGYDFFLLDGLQPGSPLHGFARQIARSVEMAASLTRQLLAVSRRQVARRRPLDVNALVIETSRLLRRVLGAEIELRHELAPSVWAIRADPDQMEQVLLNLVVNARDAMPSGGRITISTANVSAPAAGTGLAAGPYVMLSIRDTGTGMDESVRTHIFEPFFTTKEPGRGTGLGLVTVMSVIQDHSGGIAVDTAPGRGTEFRLFLPKSAGAAAGLLPGQPAHTLRGGTETILVIEDHDELRRLISLTLTGRGYKVLSAASAGAALRLMKQHSGPVHLILADLVLPDMTGREVVMRIKETRPGIKAVYMSGYAAVGLAQFPQASQITLLDKPFSPAALLGAVRDALDEVAAAVPR